MKKRILLFLFTLIFVKVFAQGSDEQISIGKFGLGFHVEQFKINDLTDLTNNMEPINKLVLTISPIASFRIEPEFGFRYIKEGTAETYLIGIGSGFFAMHQFEKLNFYGGIRIEFDLGSYSESIYDGMNTTNSKINQNRIAIAPTIGVEYFFYKSFSIGGEVSLKYTSIDNSPDNSSLTSTNGKIFGTDTGLLLRYYF